MGVSCVWNSRRGAYGMGLGFILGRAGTGKTHRCLEAVRSAALASPKGPPLVLLVPEQATFQMEQALLGRHGLPGMMRTQVLSFQRLAWRVSMAVGGLAHPPLSDLGKRLVLRALLEKRQEQLRVFGKVADRPGFIDKLARTISALRTYNVGTAELEQQWAAMARDGLEETPLAAKLHDLQLVTADLRTYTEGRFTDPDDYLTVLAKRLPESGLLTEAEVWVDSFAGFTPQELDVLAAVLGTARKVHISLCVDPVELDKPGQRNPTDLFHPTLTTYDQLLKLAAEQAVPVDPPIRLTGTPPRFAAAPDLAHLERHGLRSGPPIPWAGPTPALALVSAGHRREEVEAAAREVLRLARTEGLRLREVSLVVRNLDAYADLISTVFNEHGVPVFVDRRRTVAHHPLVELVRAALEVSIQDWAYSPVFRYFKTDLTPASRGEVDTLENYVLEHGIRGRRWHDGAPWIYVRRYTLEADDLVPGPAHVAALERINRIRLEATRELAAFHRRLSGGRSSKILTVRTITAALWGLLDDLKVAARLERWSEEAEAAGDLEGAREHQQVWDGVRDLLDQMVEGLGEAELSPSQYLRVLSAGLDGLRLGLIPPGLDQVVAGSVERSRHSGVRAALILGATEKDFPPLPPEDAIFTDRERERLDQDGLDVGPTSQLRLFQEQFYTYVALTRGASRLWLSYPLADDTGRAMTPSLVIRRLEQIFPDLPTVQAAGAVGSLDAIATPPQFAAALTRALRTGRSRYGFDPVWLDLYEWAVTTPELRDRIAPTLSSLWYEESFSRSNSALGTDLATSLYGEVLVTSVSRLESFAACAFQHFAGHGLRLKERARFQVEAPELGIFYHAAMSLFVRQLAAEGVSWEQVTPDQTRDRLDHIVDGLAPRLQSEVLLSTPQNRYVLRVLRRTLQASMNFLGEHIYEGKFRPLWVELPFGSDAPEGLPPVELELPDGGKILLRGQIDRVDGFQDSDGSWHLRVMDYKSSARNLDLGKFYHGLSLQLPLYLYAVVSSAGRLLKAPVHPAGALYFPVHDPLERLNGPVSPAEIISLRRKRYKATGLVMAEPAVVRWMDPNGTGLIQARMNKDGSLRKDAPVATAEQFGQLWGHMGRAIGSLATQLRTGTVAVAPVRLGTMAPCLNCSFKPVCAFDPLVPGQGYRTLEPMGSPAVWTRLALEGGKGDE